MVWPFTSSNTGNEPSSNSDSKSADPYSKLDPSLKQFLERESPGKYDPSTPPTRTPSARERARLVAPPDQSPSQTTDTAAEPLPPPPTLYPDGRYAHLWKTYRPRAVIEAEGKTDQEKLDNVLQSWQDRNYYIKKAALENCSAINMELDECFRKPNFTQRATMCRTETRALNRCIEMNKRFLRALGYLSSMQAEADDAKEEAIQMHADRLYTRMLDMERKAEEARKEGKDVPAMESVFDEKAKGHLESMETLTEVGKQRLAERTKDLSPVEREVEERAFMAELKAGAQTIENLEKHRAEVREARQERIESGKAKTFDRLQRWMGW